MLVSELPWKYVSTSLSAIHTAVLAAAAAGSITYLVTSDPIHVVDGDTVRYQGELVRLQGFNAPETYQAQCRREHELGTRATKLLSSMVASGAVLTLNPGTCGYGRRCGTMTFEGKDIGWFLITEGLAEPYHCTVNPQGGRTTCPKRKDWCRGDDR